MQALAIAMVMVGGVGIFIMSLSTLDSLFDAQARYYREHHFADVFATLKRAPRSLARRIEEIPGVDKVETRVVAYVSIDVPGFDDPVSGHLVSLPDDSRGELNQVYLRQGRLFEPGRDNEVLVSVEFADAHGLVPGDELRATINGRRKTLGIVALAMSPEHVYQIAPGAMFPDYRRYGILWMARQPLASAYDMDGAFNDVALTLVQGADEEDVIDRLDEILEPYGGIGAYARADQFSNRFLTEELKQQRTTATVFPLIFFGVAAFLLNVVVSRLIRLQREQIAILKAFGYSNYAVGLHYVKLVLLIVGLGVALGVAAGIWMGRGLTAVYQDLYSLPYLVHLLRPGVIASAVLVSLLVAALGTLHAVRAAVRLPPAEAMRPVPPATYRATLVERLGLQRYFSQPMRMILRHIERQPLKSALTTLGIAMACGIMVVSGFQKGAIDYMIEMHYGLSQRADLLVNYNEPTSRRSLYSLRGVAGVELTESFRDVPAKLRFEHRSYRATLQGIEPGGDLLRLLDSDLGIIDLPRDGVVLTDYLATFLRVDPGDLLIVEVLEGSRPTLEIPVVGTARQDLGMSAYMQRESLNRLLGEGDAISGALLEVDAQQQREIFRELKNMPRIAGVVEQKAAIDAFYDNVAQAILFYTFISTLLGASIAFGVIYNSMRIALSERGRELASMRVLGFERGEVAFILLGELGLLTLVAIPLGFLFGYGLCGYLAYEFDSDLYRVPLVIENRTYAFAALVTIASSLLSAVMVWRRLARLDLVAVLKTRE
jgi:putative ABC transport system permease protein